MLNKLSLWTFSVIVVLLFCSTIGAASEEWSPIREKVLTSYEKDSGAAITAIREAETVHVQPQEVSLILSRVLNNGLSADDFAEIMDRVTAAQRDGLPTEPFTDKTLEGLAKSVPTPLILSVLDTKLETYKKAKTLIGEIAGGSDGSKALTAISLAMEQGVSFEALGKICSSSTDDPNVVAHAAQTLADLETMGFSEEQGIRIVEAGIKAGYIHSGGQSIFIEVTAEARKSGRSYNDITESLESSLRRGEPLSDIAVELSGSKGSSWSKEKGRDRDREEHGGPGGSGSHGRGNHP